MRKRTALTRGIVFVTLALVGMSLLTGCGKSSKTDYLQGHSWGENESESKSIGWQNYTPVSGLEMTIDEREHYWRNDDGLWCIQYVYNYDSREDSDNQKPKEEDYYVQKFEKKYGEPYSIDTTYEDKYTWYVDGVKITLEFYDFDYETYCESTIFLDYYNEEYYN